MTDTETIASTAAITLPGGTTIIYALLGLALLNSTVTWLMALNEADPERRHRLLGLTAASGIGISLMALSLIVITENEHILSTLAGKIMFGGAFSTGVFAGVLWPMALSLKPPTDPKRGHS